MTANMTTQTTSKSPCGCGGSGAIASKPGCDCDSVGVCESCQDVIYARPQFFAGQLLTEDDLQSLGDYLVAKNRLHNRYLFGDGVVCGLAVTCAPCERGHVTVNPGYALDCCGNDIVVSCPKDLDINQMVRQLMLKLRKADCGDPCAEDAKAGPSVPASAEITKPNGNGTGVVKPPHHYCLYINYCEQPSDPVAPYATNDTCGQTTCEPTRIREGFKFELRCPETDTCSSPVATRFWNCVGPPKATEKTVLAAAFLNRYLPRLEKAVAAILQSTFSPLESDFGAEADKCAGALEMAVRNIEDTKPGPIETQKIHSVLGHVLDVATHLARFWVQSDSKLRREDENYVRGAEIVLENALRVIRSELSAQAFHSHLARIEAHALLDEAARLVRMSVLWREPLVEDSTRVRETPDLSVRCLAERVPVNRDLLNAMNESQSAVQGWLISRLEQSQDGTHCTLLCDVNAAVIPPKSTDTELHLEDAERTVRTWSVLGPGIKEFLRGCFCNALIPECPTCDDPGVLLACLTVEDCAVTEICNLERKSVLTAPNLRYWFPEICRIGEALEKWCCPPCRKESEEPDVDLEPRRSENYESAVRAAMGKPSNRVEFAMSAVLETFTPERPKPIAFLATLMKQWRAAEDTATWDAIEAARRTVAELEKQQQATLEEIKTLKSDYAKLQDRLAKLAKKS